VQKDHYKTLGVAPTADDTAIKKAYRKLALQHHPDKNPDNPLSEAVFKEIQEAYGILSVRSKRAGYDAERRYAGVAQDPGSAIVPTPEWMLNIAVELNKSLAKMDADSVSTRALQAYMLLLLADSHIEMLLTKGTDATAAKILEELVPAASKLEYDDLDDINPKLYRIAGNDASLRKLIDANTTQLKRKATIEKWTPAGVIFIAFLLCVFIYYYCNVWFR
jgi:molecular chaperone DnaJ